MARRKKLQEEAARPAERSGDPRTFEEVYEELEGIVSELESGELPLERALERFETGLRDYGRCIEILEGVERRVELLSERPGGPASAFPGYEDDAAADDEGDLE